MKGKRKKNLKNSNNRLLVISSSILALILIGVITYFWILNKKEMDININTAIENNSESTYVSDFPLSNFLTYTKPSGWNDVSPYDSLADLQSPDYQEGDSTGVVERGIEVIIFVSTKVEDQTLETEKTHLADVASTYDISDILDTEIDGIDAIKYHADDPHYLEYFAIKGNNSYGILIRTKDLSTEESYQSEIDDIINSIQFK